MCKLPILHPCYSAGVLCPHIGTFTNLQLGYFPANQQHSRLNAISEMKLLSAFGGTLITGLNNPEQMARVLKG